MRLSRRTEIALVTVPDLETGRNLAQAILQARLAACVNLVPQVESHYWWEGKLESSNELLLVIKTSAAKVADLEKLVTAHHPYDTPEFLVLSVSAGSERYLGWITQSLLFFQPTSRSRPAGKKGSQIL